MHGEGSILGEAWEDLTKSYKHEDKIKKDILISMANHMNTIFVGITKKQDIF